MRKNILILVIALIVPLSAQAFHEVKLKGGTYLYGFLTAYDESTITLRAVDPGVSNIISKSEIAELEEIQVSIKLLDGYKGVGKLNLNPDETYSFEGDFQNKPKISQKELAFITFDDANMKRTPKPAALPEEPDTKFIQIGAFVGYPAILEISIARIFGNHEVEFIIGSPPIDELLLRPASIEFDYAYLLENNRSISHGPFAAFGYSMEEWPGHEETSYLYAGGGYRLNLYFVNIKIGAGIPIFQEEYIYQNTKYEIEYIGLFQFGFSFKI